MVQYLSDCFYYMCGHVFQLFIIHFVSDCPPTQKPRLPKIIFDDPINYKLLRGGIYRRLSSMNENHDSFHFATRTRQDKKQYLININNSIKQYNVFGILYTQT